MKKRLVLAALAMIHLLLLASCTTQQPADTSETPTASVAAVSPPVSPAMSKPPVIPKEERIYLSMPCLIKLEPYIGRSYTDGVNTYLFQDDGTVLCRNPDFGADGRVFTFERKDIEKPLDKEALKKTDEYKAACENASELLGYEYSMDLFIAHKDGDTWYLYYDYPTGGGSGESYWITDKTVFVKIGPDGEFADFGALKAAHIVWYDEQFYYVELVSDVFNTPGIGKVMRVDMDGANRETIVDEPVYGTIQVTGGRIYYTSLADGKAYSVDLDGTDKTPVSEKIVPMYHRVGLEFYGDAIISKYWNDPGYVYSHFSLPVSQTTPAIMDINERNLITFPPELSGDHGYEVINWGGEDSYYDEFGSSRLGTYFLFLKSDDDGSYWVYKKFGFHDRSPLAFDGAREEWAAKGG